MADCQNMIPHNEPPSARLYSSRQLFITVALWVLLGGTLFWALFRVHNVGTMAVFLLLVFFIRLLAIRWRERFNAIMFPKPFMEWWSHTVFYQIIAMAMGQQWSKVWILFSVLPVLFWIVSFQSWREPVFDLDQMVMTNAHIEKIDAGKQGRRRRHEDIISLVTESGKRIELKTLLIKKEREKLEELKNKKESITVWYQDKGYHYKNWIKQIAKGDIIIKKYRKDWVMRTHIFGLYSFVFLSLYAIFTVCFISVYFFRKLK